MFENFVSSCIPVQISSSMLVQSPGYKALVSQVFLYHENRRTQLMTNRQKENSWTGKQLQRLGVNVFDNKILASELNCNPNSYKEQLAYNFSKTTLKNLIWYVSLISHSNRERKVLFADYHHHHLNIQLSLTRNLKAQSLRKSVKLADILPWNSKGAAHFSQQVELSLFRRSSLKKLL